MKILLTTLNSKYVHSNLALKYMYGVAVGSGLDIELQEFTINNEHSYIFGELVRGNYDVVCFSCYIWNIEYTKRVCSDLKKACPKVKIVLGGPEVSYDAVDFMETNSWVDIIMRGEGEVPFFQLCKEIVLEEYDLSKVSSITYRENGEIMNTMPMKAVSMEKLPFPYEELPLEKDKVIYFESSRGCPYRCSYCISSIDKRIRVLPLDKTLTQLGYFIRSKVKQVKFIDRTFNFDADRAYAIWEYLIENDNGVTNFHFEICGEILQDRHIQLISKARKGLFQFEIGIQSTNPLALKAVNRSENTFKIFENVEKLLALKNSHIHVDLIAGLPYENFESFGRSFNKVYGLHADDLQLGFLKLLKGTKIYEERDEHGYVFMDVAPYEVISNKYISAEELVQLKMIEKVLDLYHNRGGFDRTLGYLDCAVAETSFDFYNKLAVFYYENGFQHKSHKKENLYRILYAFAKSCEGESRDFLSLGDKAKDLLTEDLEATMNPDAVKKFMKKGWEI